MTSGRKEIRIIRRKEGGTRRRFVERSPFENEGSQMTTSSRLLDI